MAASRSRRATRPTIARSIWTGLRWDRIQVAPRVRRTAPGMAIWRFRQIRPTCLLSEQSLERMATLMGDHAMAARRRLRYDKGAKAMRDHMWSERLGCFAAVDVFTLKKSDEATIGGFMPLMANVPSAAQAATMAATLETPDWATALPIPTVAQSNPAYVADEFWRGDVWPAPNYQVASGLALYGHRAAAARVADATVTNALKVGISERYNSATGAPLGVPGLGMSSTALTMVLDGLTSAKYTMRARNAHG